MNKARAFNPFLCARTDKLMALITEVQVQMSGYEAFHKTRKRARRPTDQVTYDRTVEGGASNCSGRAIRSVQVGLLRSASASDSTGSSGVSTATP
jgi:hypothetical protein